MFWDFRVGRAGQSRRKELAGHKLTVFRSPTAKNPPLRYLPLAGLISVYARTGEGFPAVLSLLRAGCTTRQNPKRKLIDHHIGVSATHRKNFQLLLSSVRMIFRCWCSDRTFHQLCSTLVA
jgi:hypothetical protein